MLQTLTKALHLLFYYSKIWSPHGRTPRTALTATWILRAHHLWAHTAAQEMGQQGSEQTGPLGPCLNAVTLSYLCPGGYHHHQSSFLSPAHPHIYSSHSCFIRRKQHTKKIQWQSSKQQNKGSNISHPCSWLLKVNWAQLSLLCLQTEHTSWKTCEDNIFK